MAGDRRRGLEHRVRGDPQTVWFPSADGQTDLVGYLFTPTDAGDHPAVVMLHGRAGPTARHVNAGCTFVQRGVTSDCNASTLAARHQAWSEAWARHGYTALLVDSFGPHGRAHGDGRHSHDDPQRDAVNELTVRPLDAEGALAWLSARPGVQPGRVVPANLAVLTDALPRAIAFFDAAR